MPNWCYTEVEVRGERDELLRFVNDIIGKRQVLGSEIEGYKNMSKEELLKAVKEMEDKQNDVATYSKILPQPPEVITGELDWYSWRLSKWGVKWDMDDDVTNTLLEVKETLQKDPDSDVFWFDYETPWSYPDKFFEAVSYYYDLTLLVTAIEPGAGMFQEVEYENGEGSILVDEDSEVEFRFHCQRGSFDYALQEVKDRLEDLASEANMEKKSLSDMLISEAYLLRQTIWLLNQAYDLEQFNNGINSIKEVLEKLEGYNIQISQSEREEAMTLIKEHCHIEVNSRLSS